jgi:hypothetical protein
MKWRTPANRAASKPVFADAKSMLRNPAALAGLGWLTPTSCTKVSAGDTRAR